MHHFHIIPLDRAIKPMDFIGFDASGVLLAVQHLACTEARVLRDGEYCFTLRLDDSGVWHVLSQAGRPTPQLVPQSNPATLVPAAPPTPPLS